MTDNSLSKNLSINSVGARVTASVRSYLDKKSQSVFRRYPNLLGMEIDLKYDKNVPEGYLARSRLVLPGYDRIVEKKGSSMYTAIARLMEVSERQLRRRARLFKSKTRSLK
ncbi:HPF/RaiA family ribosome-associated protein [Puniceicoccaceae bacterium K14]|nr:HPF/RaiA family ribosome-associated protein [Puniceicoccaceae bacterium K14]